MFSLFSSRSLFEAAAELQRLPAGLLLPDGETTRGVLPLARRRLFLLLFVSVARLRGPDAEKRCVKVKSEKNKLFNLIYFYLFYYYIIIIIYFFKHYDNMSLNVQQFYMTNVLFCRFNQVW